MRLEICAAITAACLGFALPYAHAMTPPPAILPCPNTGPAGLLEGGLPRLAARFGGNRSLRIVAIGSSSTAGAGASEPRYNYPSQLEGDLRRRFPGRDIDVINVGTNGQEVPEMLARLDSDVLAHHPDLVIWQFGSNALLRGRSIPDMEAAARTGLKRLASAGVDVILMDLQHTPRIDQIGERDATLAMMEHLSRSTGSALFHRYRLMKAWSKTMGADYVHMVSTDQLHMTDTSYRCMADALAASLQQVIDKPVQATEGGAGLAIVPRTSAMTP